MTALPRFQAIDHLHVHVQNRAAATAWYAQALGLQIVQELAHWAEAPGGPLTLSDPAGVLHLALFERPGAGRLSTVALRVDAAGFSAWRRHLGALLGRMPKLSDHGESLSFYFNDPDGNSFEITCFEPAARAELD
ncbi:catechol-2,3-dioxygenase [Inhella inkyongensis]|uniref:Catechol-2,3-dioxygenase n=1 Tax=Inhella inkyongensis TaxID=392593 RepID=A0A840S8A3_9BURK|nr:VOC family protein [Inhella inkyongensis]MBB5204781.1 catechol-2,3-dioxygenase [Inhella inkyongensis]